jgi:hypothetical protein
VGPKAVTRAWCGRTLDRKAAETREIADKGGGPAPAPINQTVMVLVTCRSATRPLDNGTVGIDGMPI